MTEYKFIDLSEADNGKHKYFASFVNTTTGRQKVIKFGAYGYGDFIYYNKHEGKTYADKKKQYIARHTAMNEDYTNPLTRGWWAMHLLWSYPTLEKSYQYVLKLLKKQDYI